VLLDWWVLGVLIVVEPIPGMKRANRKWAIVTLRSAPDAPRHFALGDNGSSASSISSRTQGSSSTSSRPRNACVEPSDAILPSAQAACPRITDSESQSDCASTGTASSDPHLPTRPQRCAKNPSFRPFDRRAFEPAGELLLREAHQPHEFRPVHTRPRLKRRLARDLHELRPVPRADLLGDLPAVLRKKRTVYDRRQKPETHAAKSQRLRIAGVVYASILADATRGAAGSVGAAHSSG